MEKMNYFNLIQSNTRTSYMKFGTPVYMYQHILPIRCKAVTSYMMFLILHIHHFITLINNKSGTRKIPSRTKLEDVCNVTIFFLGKNKFFYFISKQRQRRPVLIFEPAYILVLMMRRRKSVVW